MKTSSFNRIIILSFIVIALPLSFFVFWLEPFSGDLTRIGGYRENEYGWNLSQKRFIEPHYRVGESIEDYNKYYDIVTIGDSFSVNKEQSWQNYLALSSKSSIITFHRRAVTISELLKYKQFKKTPPKIFIFEVVEHSIQTALHDITLKDKGNTNTNHLNPEMKFREVVFSKYMEAFKRNLNNSFSMDTALHYIKSNLKQRFGSRTKAYPKSITGKELLFSNANTESALFYHLDNLKLSISENEWAVIEQRFAAAQSIVQENNKTTFLAMVAPDKRTAYSHLIKDEGTTYQSAIEMMPGKYKVNWIHTLGGLRQMIDQEVIDVYLPNDTHWGFQGYKAAFISTKEKIQSLSFK